MRGVGAFVHAVLTLVQRFAFFQLATLGHGRITLRISHDGSNRRLLSDGTQEQCDVYDRSCVQETLHCVCIRSMNYRLFRMVAPNTMLPRTRYHRRRRGIVPFPIPQHLMLNRKTVSYSNFARLVAHLDIFLPKIGQTEQARSSGPDATCCPRRSM